MNNSVPQQSRSDRLQSDFPDVDSTRDEDLVTASHRRSAIAVCLLIALVTAALIPVSSIKLPLVPAFLPAYQTILITAYLITAYLIFGLYRANGSVSLLYLCAGCLYTAVVLAVQFLSISNLLIPERATVGGLQTEIWLWCVWHAGPPLAIFGYALSEWLRPSRGTSVPYRVAQWTGIALAMALAASILAVTVFHDWLPVLQVSGDIRKITTSEIAPAIQAMILIALLLLWWATGLRTTLNIWLAVALVALLLDNVVTMSAGSSLTIGWYAGRFNALLSALIMLLVYLREINCVYLNTVRSARQLAASNALLEVRMGQARLDSLTGLPGRALFLDQARALHARSQASGNAIAVLFIDLDGFKLVNDSMGHEHGDIILKKVADVLLSIMRDTDVAGRVGGDEFVVSLIAPAHTVRTTATAVADRIVQQISQIGHGISCSVGISLCSDDHFPVESSLRQADAAMYEAKKNGKNRFVVQVLDAA